MNIIVHFSSTVRVHALRDQHHPLFLHLALRPLHQTLRTAGLDDAHGRLVDGALLLGASTSNRRLQPFLPRQSHLAPHLRDGGGDLIPRRQQQPRRLPEHLPEVPAAKRHLQTRHASHQRRRVHLQQRRRSVHEHRDVDEGDESVQSDHRGFHPSRVPKHAAARGLRHRAPAFAATAPEVPEPNLEVVGARAGSLEGAADGPLAPPVGAPVAG
mmetsp:Transcript_3709/g.17087  ORF Transcript_3709/g.17087 Transcript_3709/m.17087 type:complete len:213 (+) Transcript_3709:277-915(+)